MTDDRRHTYRIRRPVGAPILEIQTELIKELTGRLARVTTALMSAHGSCSCGERCVLREDWVVDALRGRP